MLVENYEILLVPKIFCDLYLFFICLSLPFPLFNTYIVMKKMGGGVLNVCLIEEFAGLVKMLDTQQHMTNYGIQCSVSSPGFILKI